MKFYEFLKDELPVKLFNLKEGNNKIRILPYLKNSENITYTFQINKYHLFYVIDRNNEEDTPKVWICGKCVATSLMETSLSKKGSIIDGSNFGEERFKHATGKLLDIENPYKGYDLIITKRVRNTSKLTPFPIRDFTYQVNKKQSNLGKYQKEILDFIEKVPLESLIKEK